MRRLIQKRYLQAEWLRLSRDRANHWLLGVFALLALAAALNGQHAVRARMQAQAQTQAQAQERLERMREAVRNSASDQPVREQVAMPPSPAGLALGDGALRAALPALPGAALALGTGLLLPQDLEVNAKSRHMLSTHQNLANPAIVGGGGFDLAFVVTVLLPLAAIGLTWRVQAQDRQWGTWRLIAVVPGAQQGLLAAALLLRAAALCLLVWAAGALAVFGHAGWSLAALLSWLVYAVVALLVVVLWLGLAALLNRGAQHPPTLALALLGLWLTAGMVLPVAMDAMAPLPPSRLATIAQLRALDDGARAESAAVLEDAARKGIQAGMPMPQKGDSRMGQFFVQQALDRKAAPIVAQVDAGVAARQAYVERWSWLSPTLAARVALEALAGSDLRRHQHFMAQVDAHQAQWRAYFGPMVLALRNLQTPDLDAMPPFAYREIPALWSVALARQAGAVALWLMLCMGLVALRQRRSPPPHQKTRLMPAFLGVKNEP